MDYNFNKRWQADNSAYIRSLALQGLDSAGIYKLFYKQLLRGTQVARILFVKVNDQGAELNEENIRKVVMYVCKRNNIKVDVEDVRGVDAESEGQENSDNR